MNKNDNISQTIHEIIRIKQEIKDLEKLVGKLQVNVLQYMNLFELDVFSTHDGHKATCKDVNKYRVTSWPDIYQYIINRDAFDLLQKRLSVLSVRERLAVEPKRGELANLIDITSEQQLYIQ